MKPAECEPGGPEGGVATPHISALAAHPPCGAPGSPECAAKGPARTTVRISLQEALGRFEREATPGTCDTGRYRCRYFAWGGGPTLLLVPGLGSDARAYIPLAAQLARDHRCLLYDLPTGRGDGARLADYDLDGLSDDALALLAHAGTREANAIGWSFGSMIALHALARAPERIRQTVLLGGFARRRLAPAEALVARLLRHCQFPMRRLPWHDRLMARAHHAPFAELPAELWQFFLDRCGTTSVAAVAHRALLVHHTDLRPELPRITRPVLLVTGELDPLVGPNCTQELLHGLPNAAHVELPGCGHFAALTHTPVLAELVSRFLHPCSDDCHASGQCTAK